MDHSNFYWNPEIQGLGVTVSHTQERKKNLLFQNPKQHGDEFHKKNQIEISAPTRRQIVFLFF